MRAVSFNERAAALMGINVNRIISFTFGLGSALAARGGIFYALRAPGIEPLMGVQTGPARVRRGGCRRHRQPAGRGARRPRHRSAGNFRRRHSRPVQLPRWHRLRDLDFDFVVQTRRTARQISGGEGLKRHSRSEAETPLYRATYQAAAVGTSASRSSKPAAKCGGVPRAMKNRNNGKNVILGGEVYAVCFESFQAYFPCPATNLAKNIRLGTSTFQHLIDLPANSLPKPGRSFSYQAMASANSPSAEG